MIKETKISLSEPISYVAKGGSDRIQSQTLTVKCPTQKQIGSISVLDTAYAKYLNNSQKNMMDMFGISSLSPVQMAKRIEEFKTAFDSTEKGKEKFKLSDMKAHISAEELASCYGALQNIICSSALVDEETKINTVTYAQLSLSDLDTLLEDFIGNFIIRSQQS